MSVVSDTGPIIGYARAGLLHLFHGLFGEVLIPEQVREEVLAGGDRPGTYEVQNFPWIRTVAVTNIDILDECRSRLGLGESAAIALAAELGLPLLLEDAEARRLATYHGVDVLGSKFILEEALRRKLLANATATLQLLRARGYRLSRGLVDEILRQIGEA